MGKHKAQHPPGVQARLENKETLAQADARLQSKLGDPEQLAKDVALIDGRSYADPEPPQDKPYEGREPS